MSRRHATWLLQVFAVAATVPLLALVPLLTTVGMLSGGSADSVVPLRRLCALQRAAGCIPGDAFTDTLAEGLKIGILPFALVALPILYIVGR